MLSKFCNCNNFYSLKEFQKYIVIFKVGDVVVIVKFRLNLKKNSYNHIKNLISHINQIDSIRRAVHKSI